MDTDASRQRQTSGDSGGAASMVAEPVLRVITPSTTPEEVAAIVAVLAGLGGGGEASPVPPRVWASVARRLGAPVVPHRGAWRGSAQPR